MLTRLRHEPREHASGVVGGLADCAEIAGLLQIPQRHAVDDFKNRERRRAFARARLGVQDPRHRHVAAHELEQRDLFRACRAVPAVRL